MNVVNVNDVGLVVACHLEPTGGGVVNVDLNIGGFIGAVFGVALGGLIFYLSYDSADTTSRGQYRLVIYLLIGCALAGNFLWGKIFPKAE